MMMKHVTLLSVLIVISSGPALAQALPPDNLNYQGVLRNAEGVPLYGEFPMVFRFYSAPGGGDEILVDSHGAVGVENGLFNVMLGGPGIADGSGPGTYLSLAELFRDYMEVYLEVTVDFEILSPRVQIESSAYAFNTGHLGGHDKNFFLNVSPDFQVKEGDMECVTFQASAHLAWTKPDGDDHLGYGIHARGDYTGGYFEDIDGSGATFVGVGDFGINAQGDYAGGQFSDSNNSGYAYIGYGDRGIEAHGSGAAGYFVNDGGSGQAYIAQTDLGIRAYGSTAGGYFEDTNDTGQAWLGEGHYGIHAIGFTAGGWFQSDALGTGTAWVGYGNYGIRATGSTAGGWFDTVLVDGKTTTAVLEITGGADIAEPFKVRGTETIPDGAVVVIDETEPGALAVSSEPYDFRVAGVISGAGGIRPGLILSQGQPAGDEAAVALTGRVYCLATADNGPIRPGDLLTTSAIPGHAMKATDPNRSQGAVLGKSMSFLEDGEGLALVLVNLQ
jgi:hypothetical protein